MVSAGVCIYTFVCVCMCMYMYNIYMYVYMYMRIGLDQNLKSCVLGLNTGND